MSDLTTPKSLNNASDVSTASNLTSKAPIIVKKITGGHHGSHGGAWKIALADMMTAMMAFFLLLWILGASNEDKRKSVADFFRPSISHSNVELGKSAGAGGLLGGQSIINPEAMPYSPRQTGLLQLVTPRSEGGPTENDPSNDSKKESSDSGNNYISSDTAEKIELRTLEQDIKQALKLNRQLYALRDQVEYIREKDGLRIEIIDRADFSMFTSGTAKLLPRAESLLKSIAATLVSQPNQLVVRGHTDSTPFPVGSGRNNWSLSAERAESTRVALEDYGITSTRFRGIEGVADTQPYDATNRANPRNRRMSITVLYSTR
jgi:chemotaxis protein MotB